MNIIQGGLQMIVDFHTHIFTEKVCTRRDLFYDDHHFRYLNSSEKSSLISHTDLLKSMNKESIDYSVAMGFPWIKNNHAHEQNLYFSKLKEKSEGRIIPFGTVPLDNDQEIEKYVLEIKEMGLAGIGEIAFYHEGLNDRNSEWLKRVLSSALKLSMPVCIHVNEPVGHKYTGKYDPAFPVFYEILSEFKDLKIILSHWGGGLIFYELMKEVAASFTNFYYDTAASPFIYTERIYQTAVNIIGSGRILFGTDYPLIKPGRYINEINKNITEESDRSNILGFNAANLLTL